MCAPVAAVKAGRLAAREAGRLDARGSRRAKIGHEDVEREGALET